MADQRCPAERCRYQSTAFLANNCWVGELMAKVFGQLHSLLAVRRAVWRYAGILRSGETVWDKTSHSFPTELA